MSKYFDGELISAYEDLNKEFECKKENVKLHKQVADLQSQLAEKENRIKKLNLEAQKYYEDAYCNDFHNQNKISFAIEQLEKVKGNINKLPITDITDYGGFKKIYQADATRIIDQQIALLKGENK